MIEPNANKNIAYRPDIDGLRAIAVMSVLAYHFEPGLIRGGFVGVDIFFVISGFLISSIIYKELEAGHFSIVEFYVRRIRRIYPALVIVLVGSCIAGWAITLPSDFVLLGQQIVGGSTFVANFVLWWQSGYFSEDSWRKPLLHLWSLGVEEQYYLFFPLLCALFYRTKSRWNLPLAFAAVATLSMIINVAFVSRYADASFYLPFSRLWELFMGAGLALYAQRSIHTWESHLNPAGRTLVGLAGLAMLVWSIFGINALEPFPGWIALMPTVGTALVIFAGPLAWANRTILSWRPVVFVGLISYPLYLWHWPLLSFSRLATEGPHAKLILKPLMFVLAFVLAYLTFRIVETPIRRVKDATRRRRGALWLLASVFLTGAFGAVVMAEHGFPSRWPSTIIGLDHDFSKDSETAGRARKCFLDADQSASDFASECVDAAAGHEGQPLVLVWGDSHAADLIPGFRALQQKTGLRLAQYTASGCPPVIGLVVPERPACTATNEAVLERIRALKPDMVILSGYWDYQGFLKRRGGFDENYAKLLMKTIQDLKAAGVARVVVIGSAPIWKAELPKLLIGSVRSNPTKPVPQRLSRRMLSPHDDLMLKVSAEQAGAEFVSIFDYLCDASSCLVATGQGWQDVTTSDSGHFTTRGSALVVEGIWEQITRRVH
jgi:peptidoglycan/LPS O-acetylase OafA/YrhL